MDDIYVYGLRACESDIGKAERTIDSSEQAAYCTPMGQGHVHVTAIV